MGVGNDSLPACTNHERAVLSLSFLVLAPWICHGPVYCGSLPVVQRVFSCPLFIGYGIAGDGVTSRISCTSHACRVADSRLGLEHPRPYAFWGHRLPSPSAREPADYRQGKCGLGETSLVREPMGGEAATCSRF